jgi:uncharacterized protein involved in exopolysaccharide biosynthesis
MAQNPTDTGLPAEPRQALGAGESKSIFIVFLELFFSRWMLVCGIFFAATFWSYLALARSPDTYEATAQLLIRRGKVQMMQNVPILRQQEDVGSEVDILLSIAVVEESVNQLLAKAREAGVTDTADPNARLHPKIFGMYDSTRPYNVLKLTDIPLADPAALRKYLKSQLNIRKFGESNVIEVGLISVNPTFAAEAVNTVVDVYEKFNLQVERAPGAAAYYKQEIDRLDEEIDALQGQLAAYKQEHVVADVDKERELVTLRRYSAQIELDKLQQDKAALETDLRVITEPATRMQAAFLRNDPSIVKFRATIFDRETQIAELRSRSTADNPLVKAKEEELAELRGNLEREVELAIAQQRHIYRQALDREQELRAKIAEVDVHLAAFPMIEAKIERLDRDIKQRTIKRLDVVEQMVKASTLENPDETLSKVKILGYAQVPPIPREARKGFKFLVAVVLSAIAAFVAAIFVEGLDHSIRKRDEIEEHLNVPYLASLSSHLR